MKFYTEENLNNKQGLFQEEKLTLSERGGASCTFHL